MRLGHLQRASLWILQHLHRTRWWSDSSCVEICFFQGNRVRNTEYRSEPDDTVVELRPFYEDKDILYVSIAFYTSSHVLWKESLPPTLVWSPSICPPWCSWPLSDIYGPVFIIVSRDPVCSLSSPPLLKWHLKLLKLQLTGLYLSGIDSYEAASAGFPTNTCGTIMHHNTLYLICI